MASEQPWSHTMPRGMVSLVTPLRAARHFASVVARNIENEVVGMWHRAMGHIAVLLQHDGGMLKTVSPERNIFSYSVSSSVCLLFAGLVEE